MSRHQPHLHGGGLVAPDEGFAIGESPVPGPVQAKATQRASLPDSRAPRSLGSLLWSAVKLGSGLAVVVGASLAVAWSAHHYALTSPRFAIRTVDLVGAKHSTKEGVESASGASVGSNIFALDTDAAE